MKSKLIEIPIKKSCNLAIPNSNILNSKSQIAITKICNQEMIRNLNIHRKFDRKRFEISPPLFRTFLDQTSRGKIQTVGLFFIVVSWYTCRIQRHLRSSGFFPRWCFIHSIYSIRRVHRFRRISLVLNGYSRDPACPTTSLTCSIGSPLTFSAI